MAERAPVKAEAKKVSSEKKLLPKKLWLKKSEGTFWGSKKSEDSDGAGTI